MQRMRFLTMIVLELLLVTLPMYAWLVAIKKRRTILSAFLIILPGFGVVLVESVNCWFCVFGIDESGPDLMSFFIGHDWWHVMSGPLVLLWYFFVATELSLLHRRRQV